MGTISAATVTKTWQAMSQLNVNDAADLMNEMAQEQPVILAYLTALDDMPFDQHEKEIVLYLGFVVWQMMKQSPKRLLKVTRKKLNRTENANLESLDFLASDTDADFVSATQFMLENYEEPEVLGYIIEALMDEEEYEASGDVPIRDEYRGLAFIHLKIALDAFTDSLT
jgi:hypothetical protein